MKLFDSLRLRIAALFQGSQVRFEMEEELRSHIEHRADDLEASGLGRAEAERRARIEFGGREKYKEECHEALGGHFFEVRCRMCASACACCANLPDSPSPPLMTLALAIGANAVVFGSWMAWFCAR
jgi:hypothetical protein